MIQPANSANDPATPTAPFLKVDSRLRGLGVLILVENLPVPFDRRVWQEARSLRDAGCTVSVICPKGYGHTASYEEIEGIHVYRHGLPLDASGALGFLVDYSAALFCELMLSLRVLRRHGFDVIQACNPPDLLFLVALFYKAVLGKRFIFDHHDISPELFEAKFGRRGVLHRLLLFFEKCTFRLADASLATNESFKAIAVKRGGMDPSRVWVVKSYPDLERFHRIAPDPTAKEPFETLVGYVGVMGAQDGVDRLVRAMAHIVHEKGRSDIGCIIIGNGPEVANLKALATELGVSKNVRFTGYLSGRPLLGHLSAIDVGAIPDPPNGYNNKISMNKVFEYMSLGIPFVQFDVTESRETAGDAALVARDDSPEAFGDALLELIDDPARRRNMAAIGMARARDEFRWENAEQPLLAAYRAVTKDRKLMTRTPDAARAR